ncbi:hypothetical protein BN938_1329 [Mucinivorans hirudinis]|uniref:Uncharacterized protein n=1 Tax=Mucinivorans hirudinis TaxID=1433126 RepID=A0A060RCB3_9BACT|nr:hypothetical protein BN938_1329 [Mucinivorans hirudinis]
MVLPGFAWKILALHLIAKTSLVFIPAKTAMKTNDVLQKTETMESSKQ